MTDMGRRAGPGDMEKEDYDANEDGVVDQVIAHKISHQNGGADEISVAGLSGELAGDQPPKSHGLGGTKHAASLLALVNSKITDANLDDKGDPRTPDAHSASHENGGSDEIDCTGLDGTGGAGLLVDGTSGRVLRALFVIIGNGTDADTLKCRAGNIWNGHTVAEQDNIALNATTGHWTLSSGGNQLWIEIAGLGVNTIFCHCSIRKNDTNTSMRLCARTQTSRIRLECTAEPSGADQDMTLIVGPGEIAVDVFYITDA